MKKEIKNIYEKVDEAYSGCIAIVVAILFSILAIAATLLKSILFGCIVATVLCILKSNNIIEISWFLATLGFWLPIVNKIIYYIIFE